MDVFKLFADSRPAVHDFDDKLAKLILSYIQKHEDLTDEERERNLGMVLGISMSLLTTACRLHIAGGRHPEPKAFMDLAHVAYMLQAIKHG